MLPDLCLKEPQQLVCPHPSLRRLRDALLSPQHLVQLLLTDFGLGCSTRGRVVSVSVVPGAFLGVGEDLVGLLEFGEVGGGFGDAVSVFICVGGEGDEGLSFNEL
jgi:hypothetical protein